MKVKSLSHIRLFVILWTVAYQAPPSMEFSRQEYWSGLLFPSSGDLPDPGIEPRSPAFQADALTSEPVLKNKDITLLTKVCIVKAMVFFPVAYTDVISGPYRRLSAEELMLSNCGVGEDS